jgi:hypothetical protein
MRRLVWSLVLLAGTATAGAQISEQQLLSPRQEPPWREVRDFVNQGITAAGARAGEDQTYAPRPTSRRFRAVGRSGTVREIVELNDAAPGAIIHYTLDGSRATLQSAVYTRPIKISGKLRVRAVAEAPGLKQSYELKKSFVLGR